MIQTQTRDRRAFSIKIPRLLDLNLLILVIFLLRGTSNNIEMYLRWGLSFLWLLLAYINNPRVFVRTISKKHIIGLLAYIILKTICNIICANSVSTAIGGSISMIPFYIGIVAADYYDNEDNDAGNVIKIFLVLYIYYCIKAIAFYIQNPNAARMFYMYRSSVAIGSGYGLAFAAAIVGAYCVGILKYHYRSDAFWNSKAFVIFVLVISIIVCISVRSTITILAMIIGMLVNAFMTISQNEKRNRKKILSLFLILLFVLLLYANKDLIANWLISLDNNTNPVNQRLAVIGRYILYQQESIAISGRVNVYMQSIEAFLRNPIFGAFISTPYESLSLIGNHSSLLDELGRYGIFIGVLHLGIYTTYIKSTNFAKRNSAYGAYISLLLIALFDPISQSSASITIFFLVVLLDRYFEKQSLINN